jgi:hypothetical protein
LYAFFSRSLHEGQRPKFRDKSHVSARQIDPIPRSGAVADTIGCCSSSHEGLTNGEVKHRTTPRGRILAMIW